ncbi:MAG: efflux RND transporter periplasmic adaptor subunit [Polyangiaceae bacterium]|nr:efflux RND transporter periplasmic adaptor subunit [Polyangiaceae bacterium]
MSSLDSPSNRESPAPPKADDLGFDLPQPASLSRAQVIAACTVIAVVLGGVFALTYLPRRNARAALEAEVKSTERAAPRVEVITPKVTSSDRSLVLPGSIRPLEETVIYPRVSGYVRKWNVDIGDKVEEGQVLAEIDTPELDQELTRASAELAQAKANLLRAEASRDLSKANLDRAEKLLPAGVASQQEFDQRSGQARIDAAGVTVAKATVTSAAANIQRLRELKSFTKIVAPFAGTVVSRTIERGALVAAGNGTPLFRIAATDPVRVYVGIPQDVAPSIKAGEKATITVREFAGQSFEGTIARTAGALDMATRTMNTEVRVPNPDNKLLAGMYAEVSLTLPLPHRVLEVPATTLYNDSKGLRVAVVDADSKIRFAPITIERDAGTTILVSTGLEGTERVVKLASVQLGEGAQVNVVGQ